MIANSLQYRLAKDSIRRCRYKVRRILFDISLLKSDVYPHHLVDLVWVQDALYSEKGRLECLVNDLTEARKEWRKRLDENFRKEHRKDRGE